MRDIMILDKIARVPVMMCFLLSAMTIQAAPVKWEISSLTFADGGSGSGYFVFDADTAAVSDWKIDVIGGTTPAASDSIQRKQLLRRHCCPARLDR